MNLPFDFKDVYTLRVSSSGRQHVLKGVPRRLYDRYSTDQTQTSEIVGYDLFSQYGNATGVLGIEPPPSAGTTLSLKYYRRMTIPCYVTAASGPSVTFNDTAIYTTAAGYLAGATIGSPIYAAISTLLSVGTVIKGFSDKGQDDGAPKYQVHISQVMASSGVLGAVTAGGDNILLDIPEDCEHGIISWATHHFLSSLGAPSGRLEYFVGLADKELARAEKANEEYEDQDQSFELGGGLGYYRGPYGV